MGLYSYLAKWICRRSFASLFKALHALLDFKVDYSVASECVYVILVDNFFWNYHQGQLHILVVLHRRIIIEVFEANGHDFSIGG